MRGRLVTLDSWDAMIDCHCAMFEPGAQTKMDTRITHMTDLIACASTGCNNSLTPGTVASNIRRLSPQKDTPRLEWPISPGSDNSARRSQSAASASRAFGHTSDALRPVPEVLKSLPQVRVGDATSHGVSSSSDRCPSGSGIVVARNTNHPRSEGYLSLYRPTPDTTNRGSGHKFHFCGHNARRDLGGMKRTSPEDAHEPDPHGASVGRAVRLRSDFPSGRPRIRGVETLDRAMHDALNQLISAMPARPR
jgi:hypothetical protein